MTVETAETGEGGEGGAGKAPGFSTRFLILVLAPALTYLLIAILEQSIWGVWLDPRQLPSIPEVMPAGDWRMPSSLVIAVYVYGIATCLLVLLAIPTIGFSTWLMLRPELPGGRLSLAFAALYTLGYAIYSSISFGSFLATEPALLFGPTLDNLPSAWPEASLGALVGWVNAATRILAVAILMFLVFAAPCCLSVGREQGALEVPALARRIGWLKALLYFGAASLTVGLLSTGALYQLPLPLIAEGAAQDLALDLGRARQLFSGFAMAALLAAVYLPPALILRAEAGALARGLVAEGEVEDPRAWLDARGLRGSTLDGMVRLVALLSPLLTALIGPSLGGLLGS